MVSVPLDHLDGMLGDYLGTVDLLVEGQLSFGQPLGLLVGVGAALGRLPYGSVLTPKSLREKITGLTDVRYAVSYVRKILCALSFSKRIPDPVHVNASTNQQCMRWSEETMYLISRLKRRGFTVITQDESFFVNDVILGYRLWAPVRVPIHVPYTSSYKRVVGYGAIADDRM